MTATHLLRGTSLIAIAALALLVLAAPALAEPQDPQLDAREGRLAVAAAKTSLIEGDARRASRLTDAIIALEGLPRAVQVEALLTRCAASVSEGRLQEALAHCDRAEALGGRSWRIDGLRGLALLAEGEAEAAVEAFRAGLYRNGRSRALRRGLREARQALYRGAAAPVRRPFDIARPLLD